MYSDEDRHATRDEMGLRLWTEMNVLRRFPRLFSFDRRHVCLVVARLASPKVPAE